MSTYSLYGYNYLILPKFDVLFRMESGRSVFLTDKYMRWFALFCFMCGIKSAYTFIRQIHNKIRKIISYFDKYLALPKVEGENKYIVLLGFRDSEVTVDIVKFFSKMGYNCLLLNYKSVIDARNQKFLNVLDGLAFPDELITSNLDDINNLTDIIQFTYEEFSLSFKDKLQSLEASQSNMIIEYIVDASIFQYYYPQFDKDGDTILPKEEISRQVNQFIEVLDTLKKHMNQCSILMIDYQKKQFDDVNHKLLSDMKYTIAKNFKEINSNRIKKLKKAVINSALNTLSEESFNKLIKSSEEENNIVIDLNN